MNDAASPEPEKETVAPPHRPGMSRGEALAIAGIVLLVLGLIALASSDIWDHWFAVDETPIAKPEGTVPPR